MARRFERNLSLVAGRNWNPTWSHMHPLPLGPQPAGGWMDRQTDWLSRSIVSAGPRTDCHAGRAPARPLADRSIVDWKPDCSLLRYLRRASERSHKCQNTCVTGTWKLLDRRNTEWKYCWIADRDNRQADNDWMTLWPIGWLEDSQKMTNDVWQ